MRKGLLSLLAIIFAFTTVHAATLLHEPFSQSTGNLASNSTSTTTTGKWIYYGLTSYSTNKPATIKVVSGNLTREYYASTGVGNRLTLGTDSKARSAWYNFASQSSGSVFLSALVNIDQLRNYSSSTDLSANSNGGYLFCLGNGNNASQLCARVYTQTVMENGSPIGFKFGLSKLNEGMTGKEKVEFDNTIYSANTDILVVVEYRFQPGGDYNDIVNLYINPTPVQPDEPTIALAPTGIADISSISTVLLTEGSAQQTKVFIDEMKVTTDWESLFEAGAAASFPHIAVSPSAVDIAEDFMEVGQTYSTTINVKGASLSEGTVTLESDRPDEVTFSRAELPKAEVESANGADVTIIAKPNKIAFGETMQVTLSCGDVKRDIKISWNANKLIECSTIAELKDAYKQGNGLQMLKVKFNGEALVTHSFCYGRADLRYNLAVLQDATGAWVIRRDSVYIQRDTIDADNINIIDLMEVGNKVTGMQFTDWATCLMTNDSIKQPDFRVISTNNPIVPKVVSVSEFAQHPFEVVSIKDATLLPKEGVPTFDVSLQNIKNDSHGWGKCAKVDASTSEESFIVSVCNSVGNDGETPICDLVNQPIPTRKLNATGLVWGDAELRLRNRNDLAILMTITADCDATKGSVSGGGIYEERSTATLTATPAAHYHFVKWSDGVETATRDIQVTGDVTLTAEFAIDQHTVTASGTNGTVKGTGTFDYGTTTTLTATPADHFHFVKWSDGVTTNPREVEVTGDVTLTAVFAIDQHTVTASGENGTVSGTGTFNYGETITLTAKPADHFHFVKWSDGITTNPRDIKVTGNVSLTAEFAIDQHTVTASGENGTVSGTGTFNYGETITLTAKPADHFHFVKWSDDVTTNPRDIKVTGNVSLTAEFAIDQHTVTASGANGTVSGTGTFDYGTTTKLTATPDAHFHFVKWSDDVTTNPRDIEVTGNVSLTAEFAIDQHTVTASGENGTVSGTGTFNYGETITLKATPADHFHFVKWSDDVTTNPRDIEVTGNVSLTAEFAIDQHTVTASGTNGTVTGAGTFNYGETITLKATPDDHFHFVKWSDDVTTNPRDIKVTGNITLNAVFEATMFTVNATCNAKQGTITGAGTFQEGSTVTLVATPKNHFQFVKWSDGVTTATRSFTLTEDVELTAEFEAIMFTVNATCNAEQGSVTGSGTFQEGSTATLTATPLAHYHFVKWSDDVTTNPRDIQVTSDVTLTAEFAIDQHTVTASGANGTVSGTGTFNYGETVKLTATPDEHYHFVKWSDDVTTNPRDIEVTGNVSLTAEFAIDQHTVTASGTNGTVTGAGTFNYGETITLTAKPADHFHFVKWSDDVTTNPRDIQVTENITLTAEFAIDQHTVTASGANGTVSGTGTFDYGTTTTLTATPADHFHFVKWSDDVTTNPRDIQVTENITLTAEFAIDQHIVTATGANGTVTGTGTFNYGETITLTAKPADHFHFVKWSDDVTTNPRDIEVTGNVSLTAEFAIDQHTVTASGENGTVSGTGTFNYGETITLTAKPADHFRFAQWSDGEKNAERTVTVTEDLTFTAEFEAIEFTVTVEWDAAKGSVIGAGTFQEGTITELTANAVQGFRFFQWSDGNTENPRTVTVEGDLFLTAIFVQDKPTTLDQSTSTETVQKVMRDGHVLIMRNDDVYDLTGRKQ